MFQMFANAWCKGSLEFAVCDFMRTPDCEAELESVSALPVFHSEAGFRITDQQAGEGVNS